MTFSKLSEYQIRKAEAEGQFDDLKGAGKPLGRADDGDFAENVGFRIMAEAGALPKEVELKLEEEAQLKVLAGTTGAAARKEEMRKLADVQMRRAIQEEARRKYWTNG
ncbi:MAG: DnaJ family domain-containing protein [Cognatishimia sp.]